jgi:hypothetical protein
MDDMPRSNSIPSRLPGGMFACPKAEFSPLKFESTKCRAVPFGDAKGSSRSLARARAVGSTSNPTRVCSSGCSESTADAWPPEAHVRWVQDTGVETHVQPCIVCQLCIVLMLTHIYSKGHGTLRQMLHPVRITCRTRLIPSTTTKRNSAMHSVHDSCTHVRRIRIDLHDV